MFEIDQPSVFAHKEAILEAEGAVSRADRIVVPADLREDWPEALRSSGFDPEHPTAWVAEGLLFYLPETAVHQLLDATYRLSTPGSALATDMMSASPGPPQEFKDLFAGLGAPFVFTTDDLGGLLRSHGWETEEIRMDEVAHRVGTELPAQGQLAIARRTIEP